MKRWTDGAGTIYTDVGTQLETLRSDKSGTLQANAPELADALIDLVCATPMMNYSPAFWNAVHVLDKCKIKFPVENSRRIKIVKGDL